MTTNELATWTFDGLTYKLIDGHDLVGIDSGNVRRLHAEIDGSQVGAGVFDALEASPEEVRQLPVVAETLSHGAYIRRD